MTEHVLSDGTVIDNLGNFQGIDQTAASRTWVTWKPKRGSYGETMPRSRVAHLAPRMVGRTMNVTSGDFPLACGRWAPSGWDANVVADPYAPRCKRCEKALAKVSA